MQEKDKRSFFERLTGTMNVDEEMEQESEDLEEAEPQEDEFTPEEEQLQEELFETEDGETEDEDFEEDEEELPREHAELEIEHAEELGNENVEYESLSPSEEGELAVDVYEDEEFVYVQAMIAGVKPDNIDVSITRDMVTLRGRRINPVNVPEEDYYHKELYWGGFSRKILLPEEIDPGRSRATEKHGLLALRLPKFKRKRSQKLEVESVE